jgi:hypothetical protein
VTKQQADIEKTRAAAAVAVVAVTTATTAVNTQSVGILLLSSACAAGLSALVLG